MEKIVPQVVSQSFSLWVMDTIKYMFAAPELVGFILQTLIKHCKTVQAVNGY